MVVAICSKCHKKIPDSFHEWKEDEKCKCRDWYGDAKKKGWNLK